MGLEILSAQYTFSSQTPVGAELSMVSTLRVIGLELGFIRLR